MGPQIREQNNDGRRGESVYLGEAIVADVAERSARFNRTWSGEVCWLLDLGLRARSEAARSPETTRDDGRGRRYFYPPDGLAETIRGFHRDVEAETDRRWSYSAAIRALLIVGMRIEDVSQRQLEAILSKGAPPCASLPDPSGSAALPITTGTAQP